MTTDMLETARRYVAAGLSVIPIRRWSKRPDALALGHPPRTPLDDSQIDHLWQAYRERLPNDQELRHWFTDTDCGIGIVGGAVSGGLVRLDFEHPVCLPTWYQLVGAIDPVLGCLAATLPVVQTGKGHHVYLRMADPPGHEVLCTYGAGADMIVFSETQGEGCYCLAPPTRHYNDNAEEFGYRWCGIAGVESIPTLEPALAQSLIEAARFPGFWQPAFKAPWGDRVGDVTRNGMMLNDMHGRAGALWLDWLHLDQLRVYLDRYAGLLKAVETAPPPPPSYNDAGDDEGDWG